MFFFLNFLQKNSIIEGEIKSKFCKLITIFHIKRKGEWHFFCVKKIMKKKLLILSIMALGLTTGCFKDMEEKLDVSAFTAQGIEVNRNKESKEEKQNVEQAKNEDVVKYDVELEEKNEVEEEKNNEEEETEISSLDYIEEDEVSEEELRQQKQIKKNREETKYKKLKGEIDGIILDCDELDNLNNDRYSWWLRLNEEHKLSGIDPYAEKLLDEYQIVYAGDQNEKKIYLTFDEGYENGYTPQILDTLKENNVKAIFFITGSYLKRNPELVKRMLDEGHKVGSHSVNHPSFPEIASKNYEKLQKEMLDLEENFYNQFGIGFSYIRPPRGEYSQRTLKAANQLGYKNVFWSYAYKDYDVNDQRGTDYAYSKVMNHLHNGMVVLLHAVSKDNANALDKIIKDAKLQGYEICPFDL